MGPYTAGRISLHNCLTAVDGFFSFGARHLWLWSRRNSLLRHLRASGVLGRLRNMRSMRRSNNANNTGSPSIGLPAGTFHLRKVPCDPVCNLDWVDWRLDAYQLHAAYRAAAVTVSQWVVLGAAIRAKESFAVHCVTPTSGSARCGSETLNIKRSNAVVPSL